MKRIALAALGCAALSTASAQGLQPGEWEFTTTMSSPMFPKPQRMTMKHCVTPEQAKNPEKWMGEPKQESDCTVRYGTQGGGVMTWDMSCPKSGMTGKGTAKIGPGTMESELAMRGDMGGRPFEMLSKTSGRRLGPCKS